MLILNIREIRKIRRILEKDISLSTATSKLEVQRPARKLWC